LAVWDLLLELGYEADGLYIGLGIGDYSDVSGAHAVAFAESRGLRLRTIDLRDDLGDDVPTGARATRRVPCSACGQSKHHLFDSAAREGCYDAVATGHHLDDEAAVLLGNTLRWDVEYLARQSPLLPGGGGFPRKIKALVRLTERETAAWCIVRGIDYQVEECPVAAGNRHLGYNGDAERARGAIARFEGRVLSRIAGADDTIAGDAQGRRRRRARYVRPLRQPHDRRCLCVLQAGRGRRRTRSRVGGAPDAGWPTMTPPMARSRSGARPGEALCANAGEPAGIWLRVPAAGKSVRAPSRARRGVIARTWLGRDSCVPRLPARHAFAHQARAQRRSVRERALRAPRQ